jgi:F0F1-type ATP synthase membrane subunit b/b'
LEDAKKRADDIVQNASAETKRIQDELTKNWEMAVKATTKSVVKKLLKERTDLQDTYLKTLIDDVKD